MNEMLLLFIVGVTCTLLGGIGHWWCWARPRYDEDADDLAYVTELLRDEENAHDATIDQLDQAEARAEAAETALGHRLLTDAGVTSLEAARTMRGRA